MTFRQWAKYRLYGLAGAFPYFGVRVHFPKGSSALGAVLSQGVFEAQNVRMLQQLCRPGSYMFDVGANLGLMALPVLRLVPDSRVVSFEPSPNNLPWLKKTISMSGAGDRWQLIEKAVACQPGTAEFNLSAPTEGFYDGLRYTRRVPHARQIEIPVTNLDLEWRRLACPPVSIIKIDVEGGELDVLNGGKACLAATRPFVLLEWCHLNLKAYGTPRHALFDFACEHDYALYALPEVVLVPTAVDLELQSIRTESFLMAPHSNGATSLARMSA